MSVSEAPQAGRESSSRQVKSRVDLFLAEHQLAEYAELFAQNGFDDLEDLVELVQHQHESALVTMIPKVGHRIRFIRSVNAVCSRDLQQSPTAPPALTRDALVRKEQNEEVESVTESVMSYVSAMPDRGRIVSMNNLDEQPSTRDTSVAPSITSMSSSVAVGPRPNGGGLAADVTGSAARLDDPSKRERENRRKGDLDRRRVSSLNVAGAQNPGMPLANRQLSVKVVVVGQGGSGKSCFIARLVRNEYSESVRTTLGVEFSEKRFMVGNTVLSLQFWDVWGQENTMSATRSYYTGARGAIVMYDSGDKSSLEKAIVWKKDIDAKARFGSSGLAIPVILVGSKYDLTVDEGDNATPNSPASASSGSMTQKQKDIQSPKTPATPSGAKQPLPNQKTVLKSSSEIQDFVNANRFTGHFFASAKTGMCVRSVAEYLVLAVLKMDPHDTEPTDHKVVTLDHTTRARRATGLEGSPTNPKPKSKFRCVML
jgi:small GTP-binding protein